MTDQITPDMIWYMCMDCERAFTLADMAGDECPWCGSYQHSHYEDEE